MRNLHSAEKFFELLQRERARTDRGGSAFSLLTFTAGHKSLQHETIKLLAGIFRSRLRLTDDAGWLDSRRIGVLLPDTDVSGAWKVADDVCRRLPQDGPIPQCKAYFYPSDQLPGEEELADEDRDDVEGDRLAAPVEAFLTEPSPVWKRLLDVVGATLGLVLLSPLFAIVACVVKLTSPGPVFFKQYRSGLGGERFLMYKFRTMCDGAENRQSMLRRYNEQDGPAFKLAEDPRLTSVGRFLRQTSIDELPQLLNVLKGEMSLVGPRPLPCGEADGCHRWQRRRLDVTPGLTCIWQVRGRSSVSFEQWIRMDMEYIHTRSLWRDLKLILQTVPAVLLRRGAR